MGKKKNDNNKSKKNEKRKIPKGIIFFLGVPILVVLVISIVTSFTPTVSFKYSEIVDRFRRHEVVAYAMNMGSGNMEVVLKSGEKISYSAPSASLFYDDVKGYIKEYNEKNPNAPLSFNLTKAAETSWIVNAFTYVIMPMMLVAIMGWLLMRKITVIGGDATRSFGFGKAKSKNDGESGRKAKFEDVAGADEEKEELAEVVDFLKTPEKYNSLGARIPKGVLLVGPPGTGKTLLARAVAGEADVAFFCMSGSDFVEMFVGVGASRVRDLFERAKKNVPCVIFIDEIDAVGRRRGAGLGGGHDEREQTLNQLLVEMDGFGTNTGVVVIAATNRLDILDPALIRPGRFDRSISVGYPDTKGREEILRIHAKGKPFASDVTLRSIAKSTAGFTGADLENLLNESALLAARRNKNLITKYEVEEATVKVIIGMEKKSHVITEEERKITAYHEGGHAIVTYFCKTQDPVHQISIIPRGMAGGYTLSLAEKDFMYASREKLHEEITVGLGGHAAELVAFGEIWTGASNDIKCATKTARLMVTQHGMSDEIGPISYSTNDNEVFIGRDMGHFKTYSEDTANKIDFEIKKIITKCYKKAEDIIKKNIEKLHEIAEFLISNEKMDGEQFAKLMAK